MLLDRDNLIDALLSNVCRVVFTKADQSRRVMLCTLQPSKLPVKTLTEAEAKAEAAKPPRKINTHTICAFDIEKQEWRSFVVCEIISFERTTL